MKTIIVVGNGMVGYKFCEKFVTAANNKGFRVIVFGEEPRPAYDRVHLSEFFENQDAKALEMAPAEWYAENAIDLIVNERVSDIQRNTKTIITAKNRVFTYDYLVLATGSSAFVPPIKGVEKEGVFVYRTIEDLEGMLAYADKLRTENSEAKAAVLGGGLLGLEAGKAVMDMGLEPHIVEFAPKLMPRQLDSRSSQVLQLKLESIGLNIHLSKATNQILGDEGRITGMEFGEDDVLNVDMLVVSAGIRPRDELGKTSGLEMGVRGGIVVNNKMQTSDENIYAIGEVALYNQMIYGLVAPGYDMAGVAVDQILGNEESLMPASIDMSTKLKLIGVDVASFGEPFMPASKGHSIIFENKTQHLYKRINVSLDGKKLLGGILVGDASDYNMLHQIYLNGMKIPEDPAQLILPVTEGSSSFGDVMDLPDEAQVCSCENVTKGQICGVIESGEAKDLADVVSCTKAGTGCGGCKPMVKDITTATLKSLGIEVKDSVCEHFDYNRQDLYKIIEVKGYTTFNEVLDNHGNGGHGCELCKPLVASLMATINADTANKEYAIQDSNDRFLANIQRNGTYSVVPRVPGGEITPDKLIALGEIAKKYDLYTKVTGGVRIDLFGATLNQLPLIWKELIAHGFESGHAYGKSLRTVKTCVGSTWCRYGMAESVSFGIELENRYRGIRAPHKIKGGVSGCIRECAEARGKDFGLIAVEGGWNLYLGGNGGANPRHAELFAEQIDNETVVKYLDRYLMFYMRTAKPLQRTAAWQERLEGGLEYLKEVIIDDKLGIAEDLETEMETLVNKFECEWTQAVNDPEVMKRFNHFVNSDEEDDNIVFVPMRDQKMPEQWV
ncbi:nitrite reductase large subunit [Polaribacter reichenbachii]|uniref:Nitrite reductase n=1 Tax=Polaribacter reichenbachii TaxID=996801 RepID=A0A1B8TRY7_9FLAO|nr:nitrite reductase large subunit NirB [Polaribacter reichenbachii]APZ44934.1 nitrite reductase large subunit [Polaribacter reichenbachii]AUC18797.1 nitrite reductase large subunit [Polaribacter reichenbachii]OBY62372.1 nitrite reductase [Polaribacter reichenbachii]